jgi:hypothetical protein
MPITSKRKLILTGAVILAASYVIHYGVVSVMSMTSQPPVQQPKPNPFPAIKPIVPTPLPRPASLAPAAPAPPPPAAPTVAAVVTPLAASSNTPPQAPAVPAPAPTPASTDNVPQTTPQPENLLLQPQHASALSGIWVGNAALGTRGMCRLRFEFHDDRQETNHYQGFFQLWCNATAQDRIDPEAATFTGTTDNGGITFKAANLIGTDSHGCAPASFNVIPFGAGQIVGKWSESRCPGGHMIMQRGR